MAAYIPAGHMETHLGKRAIHEDEKVKLAIVADAAGKTCGECKQSRFITGMGWCRLHMSLWATEEMEVQENSPACPDWKPKGDTHAVGR